MKRSQPPRSTTRIARRKGVNKLNRKRAAKRKAEANQPYQDWIRGKKCVACLVEMRSGHHRGYAAVGDTYGDWWSQPSEACHCKSRGAGGKIEGNLWPGCRHHHDERHHGVRSFQNRYGLDLKTIAATLWTTYQGTTFSDAGLGERGEGA